MNPEAEVELKRIAKKSVEELTVDDIAFLQARQTYLSREEKDYFKDVLKMKVKPKAPEKGKDNNEDLTNNQIIEILESRGVEIPKKINKDILLDLLNKSEMKAPGE